MDQFEEGLFVVGIGYDSMSVDLHAVSKGHPDHPSMIHTDSSDMHVQPNFSAGTQDPSQSLAERYHSLPWIPDSLPGHEIPHGCQERQTAVGFSCANASEDATEPPILDVFVKVI